MLRKPLLSVLLLLPMASCSYFNGNDIISIELVSCDPSYVSDNSISSTHATLRHMETQVNGWPVSRWFIYPDQPSDIIYEACNLPDTVKQDWLEITFEAYLVHSVTPPTDTLIHGITDIELSHLEVNKYELE
jgi:hypothetical protein